LFIIKIGDKNYRFMANIGTMLTFSREFDGADMLKLWEDLASVESFNVIIYYQFLWAMNRTAEYDPNVDFPGFYDWAMALDGGVDLHNDRIQASFVEEIQRGFLGAKVDSGPEGADADADADNGIDSSDRSGGSGIGGAGLEDGAKL